MAMCFLPRWQGLQQQVAGLHEQLRGQEARWSAALRDLQTQLDALKKQNPGLRDGRRPSELRGPEARRSAASPQPRRHSDTLVPKGSCVFLRSSIFTRAVLPQRALGRLASPAEGSCL